MTSRNDEATPQISETDIAIVGMAGRFPGARNVAEFWANLRDGVESVSWLTDEQLLAAGVDAAALKDPEYVRAAYVMPDMDQFDAGFFGFSPREASIMDPQQRHFLETAWEAMETAGHTPAGFSGNVGVFAGCGASAYMMFNLLTNPELVRNVGWFLLRHTGNDKDFLATRLSYLLNLRGPSINVQTACSTSLVAIHLACQSLLNRECDMALAGGSTVKQPHHIGYKYQEGEIMSPDGHCRAFDDASQGTVFGSGTGVVVLRRLADAIADGDFIHAVIKGSAVNNDGSQKVGYLAPSVDGQATAIAEALALSGVEAETVNYVETHGTGTPVGDPIEVAAMTQAFATLTDKTQFCAIGSLKPSVGHLDTAAGVASVIKTAEALKHKQIPASLNFSTPNSAVDWESSPFFVNAKLTDWQQVGDAPRRAGINSLGAGGTNAHVVLEEAPEREPSGPSRAFQLFPYSAKTPAAAEAAGRNLAAFLRSNAGASLADVAYTLQVGRSAFANRKAVVAATAEEAAALIEGGDPKKIVSGTATDAKRSVAFMFAGGGAQYARMGLDLYESEPVYREAMDACLGVAKTKLGLELTPLIFPSKEDAPRASETLERPSLALPALLSTQYALARLWMSWGVQPSAMIGHSMGEYTAALLAGVFSLEDALTLVTVRGRLFEKLPLGGMLSVSLSAGELKPFLGTELSLGAVNAPELCMASGPVAAIEALQATLEEKEIDCRRIHINVAAHSAMLEPILKEFGDFLKKVKFNAPQLPFVSNLSGTWITPAEATSPEYWVRHLRNTVNFAAGAGELLKDADRILLEVGPGRTLATLSGMHPTKTASHAIFQSMRHPDDETSDVAFLLGVLGRLWSVGAEIDWSGFYAGEKRNRVVLPTYPFEHQRYWIEPGKGMSPVAPVDENAPATRRADIGEWLYQPSWKRAIAPAAAPDGNVSRVLVFRDEQGIGATVDAKLRAAGRGVVSVLPGAAFARVSGDTFAVNPASAEDFAQLVGALVADGGVPADVLHLWTATDDEAYESVRDRGFYGLLHFAQALGQEDVQSEIRLTTVSSGMQQVAGERVLTPAKALVLGPTKVMAKEFANVKSRSVDVELPRAAGSWQEARVVAQILAELDAKIESDDTIAYRGADRWVQTFENVPLPAAAEGKLPRVRENGAYLITGGLGGIALTVAEQLAKAAGGVKLVLVGRTGLPAREQWAGVVAERGEDDRVSRQIAAVRALEGMGAEVSVVAADVTDAAQMSRVVAQAKASFGAVHGVIHAAGALDDQLIAMKTPESAEKVLAPKVRGTMVLDEALSGEPLDFFVVFSSRGAIAAPTGQVDYAAANAFLDAFAHRKTALDGVLTVAINWSMWSGVGMVAEMARASGAPVSVERATAHPLLQKLVAESAKERVYSTRFNHKDFWMISGHRIRGEEALIPGTGYLELARAAFDERANGASGPVELSEILFVAPFVVHEGEEKELRVKLQKNGGEGTEFVIIGEAHAADGRVIWQEHARGVAAHVDAGAPRRLNVAEIAARCTVSEQLFAAGQQRGGEHLALGPRWSNLRRIRFGNGEAIGEFELPAEFAGDLTQYGLHPALLDVATACAQPLVPGYDPHEDFYVPVSYGRVVARAALPAKFHSYIRLQPADDKSFIVFDITLVNEQGVEVVEINDFTMMRVADKHVMAGEVKEHESDTPAAAAADALADDASAITLAEGAEVFRRVLAAPAVPAQVIVSPQDFGRYLAQLKAPARPAATEEGGAGKHEAPLPSVDVSQIEAVLAAHEAVRQAVVLAHVERPATVKLAAFVVYEPGEQATVSELRRFLRERLPEDMVPQHFEELDALPLAANGAVDRSALVNPFGPSDDFVAPRTATEKTIGQIWSELLGMDRISVYDNFLDVGGHSLLAMRALAKIGKKTGVRLNPSVMNLQTLEQIAAQVDEKLGVTAKVDAPAPQVLAADVSSVTGQGLAPSNGDTPAPAPAPVAAPPAAEPSKAKKGFAARLFGR